MVGEAFVEIESMGPITEIGIINDDSLYRATINWKAVNSGQMFNSGDFFTFTVPSAFGNKTIDMLGSDNMAMGKILIDSNGHIKILPMLFIEKSQDLLLKSAFL